MEIPLCWVDGHKGDRGYFHEARGNGWEVDGARGNGSEVDRIVVNKGYVGALVEPRPTFFRLRKIGVINLRSMEVT